MSSFTRVLLISGAMVLVFDTLAATASRVFGFPYAAAALGSWLIYAGAGFFGARAGGSVWMGVLAAATTGLVDSTAGWLISAVIGPGRPTGAAATPSAIALAVVMVPVSAAMIGAVGAVSGETPGLGSTFRRLTRAATVAEPDEGRSSNRVAAWMGTPRRTSTPAP